MWKTSRRTIVQNYEKSNTALHGVCLKQLCSIKTELLTQYNHRHFLLSLFLVATTALVCYTVQGERRLELRLKSIEKISLFYVSLRQFQLLVHKLLLALSKYR